MSEVWNHFYMAPNGLSVNCNHCGKFMKRSDSSTKSMWGHLKAFHSDLVGEETFRLKRTRRMRGENNGDNNKKSKISRQKKPKIENLENTTECQNSQNSQNSNSSSCSSNISENNTSSEEEGEENIKNSGGFEYCSSGHSGSNTPLFAEGKRQMIKEEGIEEDKHFEVNSALERGKQPMGPALSIQTLLKLEENEDGMKCPQSVGENADQKFEKQKEGKLSPAHGSEAPQQAINNLNFEMTQQQNLPFDPQILAKLETHQKRKSGLTSATLLATPTSSTSEPPSTPLQVLAETASSINNKMFPNVSKNESQPSLPKIPRQENNFTSKQQQLINEHHLAESLAESLVLYGMHRIAMDLQLSYSVQANKQGKAEYAFYKNSGGIST
uniref:BED-type domain-containing protein n=1 Tax=Meloidogyne javanica TaxID=6303 RepID=A0A915MLG6_MELJA